MTEEKKSQIRKKIAIIEVALAALLVIYLIYGIAANNNNQLIFNCLAVVVVIGYVVLNDFVEPYLTEVFVNMDDFRKTAYKKYILWDVASMAGLLAFVLNFTQEGNVLTYAGIFLYFIGSKQKRTYQSAYLGDVTKEDVEAAKAAAEVEAEKVQEAAESTEE